MPGVIVASAELHLQLLRDGRELRHELRGIGVVRIEPVRDPHGADIELRKIVVVGREARHMIGVIVGEDDQREVVAGLLLHVLHALVDAADVGRMNAAIDEDMRGAVLSRHRQQEEIAEADAVHPNADVAVPAGARGLRPRSRLRSCRRRGFRGRLRALRPGFGRGWRAEPFEASWQRLFEWVFWRLSLSGHDLILLVQQAEVGLEVSWIFGVADREALRDAKAALLFFALLRTRCRSLLCRWRIAPWGLATTFRCSSLFSSGASTMSVTPARNGKDPAWGTAASKFACLDWMISTTISMRSRPLSLVRKTGWKDGTVTGRLGSRPSAARFLFAQPRSTSPLWSFSALVRPLGLPKTRPSIGGRSASGASTARLPSRSWRFPNRCRAAGTPPSAHRARRIVIRGIEVFGNGDEGAQEIAEGHVDGRAVINGASAELEELTAVRGRTRPEVRPAVRADRHFARLLPPAR